MYTIGTRVSVASQLNALRHVSSLDIAWHEHENTGNKLKRIQTGSEGYNRLLRILIDNVIEIGVNFVGMMLVLAFVDSTVAIIMGVFLVTHLLISYPLAKRASATARLVNPVEEDVSGLGFEMLNNIRSVKVMSMFQTIFDRLNVFADRLITAINRRDKLFRLKTGVQALWAHGFRIITFIVIALGIASGHYEVGFLVLFNGYFISLRDSVETLSGISQDIMVARYSIARLEAMRSEPITIDDETGKIDFPRNWKKISFNNVSFAYGTTQILKNVSFQITRGESIGVMGLSGAGKSTIFKLLLKEYEHFTGKIFIDGTSIRDIKKSSYFERVAVVLQDTEVFNFSLRDNITLGHTEPADTEKRLATALSTAHVTDFLPKLSDGLETVIGEKGIKLSGGERQRVGIARAVFRAPDLLFMDEATSHLDLESEEKIKDSLGKFFKQVTAVVIAHRLTTIQSMDRIIVLEGGQIIEEGDFATLYAKKGRLYEMWEKQRF
jgi:ABC-type multidrug transport system fused ATPase/permease subunit